MIFQHTWQKVLSGEKTQTRRLVKQGEGWATDKYDRPVYSVVLDGIRPKYIRGKTYAVQPGRGKSSVARIVIDNIAIQDVRKISDEDARAEGFYDKSDFWFTWVEMHDKSYYRTFTYASDTDQLREYDFFNRPDNRYMAWVLTFKLVQP